MTPPPAFHHPGQHRLHPVPDRVQVQPQVRAVTVPGYRLHGFGCRASRIAYPDIEPTRPFERPGDQGIIGLALGDVAKVRASAPPRSHDFGNRRLGGLGVPRHSPPLPHPHGQSAVPSLARGPSLPQ